VVEYKQAIKFGARNFNVYNNLAETLRSLKRDQEAIAYYKKAIEICPGSVGTHYQCDMAMYHEGRLEEAIEEFQKVSQPAESIFKQ